MIYVECDPDKALVRIVGGLRARDIRHEFQGKGAVVYRVATNDGARGLVDQDPGSVQPKRLAELPVKENRQDLGLQLRTKLGSGARLVVICPRLEEWLYDAASESDVDPRSFRLPTSPRDLKKEVNHDLRRGSSSRYERFLRELMRLQNRRLTVLRQMIRGQ